jgi:hypothetical protein
VSECGPHGRARHSADRGAATQCRRGMRTLPSSPCAAGRARAGAKVSSCARTAQARSICAGVNPCGGPIRIWKWIGVLRVRSRVEFAGLRRDTNMGLWQRGSWPLGRRKIQLAYQNAPLYTFTLDKSPGDMNGNTSDNFSLGGKNVTFTWKAVTSGGANNAPAQSPHPARPATATRTVTRWCGAGRS